MILIEEGRRIDKWWYTGKVFRCATCLSLVMPEDGDEVLVLVDPIDAYPFNAPSIEAGCPYCNELRNMTMLDEVDAEEAMERFHDQSVRESLETLSGVRSGDGVSPPSS